MHTSLHWRHDDHNGISNHQPHGCLLTRLFRRRSKKTSKLRVTGLCAGNSPGPVNSPHKGPVTRKMFPFDDVIMFFCNTFCCVYASILNALAPGRCRSNFTNVFLKFILQIDILSTSCEIGLRWMLANSIDYKSTLVQAMAWYRQTSHYL